MQKFWIAPLRHCMDCHRHFECNTSCCVHVCIHVWECVCLLQVSIVISPSWGELAAASHQLDCIMVYIYCTNTLSGPLCLSHKAHTDLHGDSWEKENENTPNPKKETTWWDKLPSCTDHKTSALETANKTGYDLWNVQIQYVQNIANA